jgi:hypothetical protein
MIDPFPSEDRPPIVYDATRKPLSILGAAGSLFGTLRSQSMLKPDELKRALRKEDPSRFLISPKRRIGREGINGSRAIACGCLGGFGGFLDKDFRRHDFYLGRINCKSFLQRHFSVPAADAARNPIFADSYTDARVRSKFEIRERSNGVTSEKISYPIIPDVNKLLDTRDIKTLYIDLKFPSKDEAKFKIAFGRYDGALAIRIRTIVESLLGDGTRFAFLGGFAIRLFKHTIIRKISNEILSGIEEWGLFKGTGS